MHIDAANTPVVVSCIVIDSLICIAAAAVERILKAVCRRLCHTTLLYHTVEYMKELTYTFSFSIAVY